MKCLLDTNTCIYALKRQGGTVDRLQQRSPEDLGVTIITVAELWFGARKSARPQSTRREVDAFLKPFDVLPLDRAAADAYGQLRFELEHLGRPIGERDLLIASIGVAQGLTIVTHNISEFGRVPSLKIEDWA